MKEYDFAQKTFCIMRENKIFLFGGGMRNESAYQSKLIKRLQNLFPGCFILRNDPGLNQGIPDILVLFNERWAMLEIKMSLRSPVQPNQEFYVDAFNAMSFAAFICPETEDEVLDDLQSAFGVGR